MNHMLIGRGLLLILSFIIGWYVAFKNTPELDRVENAWIYRLSYGMLIVRGFAYIFFDAFELFPLC